MERDKKKIRKNKWYIVDLTKRNRKGHYRLLNKEFENKKQAKNCLKRYFEDRVFLFDVVKGKTAIEFRFRFVKNNNKLLGYIEKYDYPPERMTIQEKKSFRTKYRRWKRENKPELTKIWA